MMSTPTILIVVGSTAIYAIGWLVVVLAGAYVRGKHGECCDCFVCDKGRSAFYNVFFAGNWPISVTLAAIYYVMRPVVVVPVAGLIRRFEAAGRYTNMPPLNSHPGAIALTDSHQRTVEVAGTKGTSRYISMKDIDGWRCDSCACEYNREDHHCPRCGSSERGIVLRGYVDWRS